MAWHAEDTLRGLYRIDDSRLGAEYRQRLAMDLEDRSCPDRGRRLCRTIGHRAARISYWYSPLSIDETPVPHGGVNLEMAEWLPIGSGVRRIVVLLIAALAAVVGVSGQAVQGQGLSPEAPTSVAVYSIETGKLEVRWSSSDAATTTGFEVQWKSGTEAYDSSRQEVVDPATSLVSAQSSDTTKRYKHTLTGLTDETAYTVRVIATKGDNKSSPSPEVTGSPQSTPGQARAFIENEVVAIHEGSFPWLRETWSYMTDENIQVSFNLDNTNGVAFTCSPYGTPGGNCRATTFLIHRKGHKLIYTITHELGHVVSLSADATAHQGPVGIAHVYFSNLHSSLNLPANVCPPKELYTDMLMVLVHGNPARRQSSYWASCIDDTDIADEALAVVGSAISGEIPSWFGTTYNDSGGDPDLERFWADAKRVSDVSSRTTIVFQLRGEFGGYCDTQKATNSAFGGGTTRNPWREGGCVPEVPGDLAFTVVSDRRLAVSWEAPTGDGGSPVEEYKVEWKSGSEEYDPSRQAKVTDLADRSRTIPGLLNGTEYTVRILAYNHNGDGAASDEVMATPTAIDTTPPIVTGHATVSHPENDGDAVATYEAWDLGGTAIIWSRSGTDAGAFTITGGVLGFLEPPDYEYPTDADRNGVYEVTVRASDGANIGESAATVTVTNVEEEGALSLSPARLRVGTVVRAPVSDPDGDVHSVHWEWSRSSDRNGWQLISGVYGSAYELVNADSGMYLLASAFYTDGEGSGKYASDTSETTVGNREPAPELSVTTLVSGLTIPWDLAFTPDGTMLFTERSGVLSSRATDGTVRTVTADFGDLYVMGESGLMAIIVDPGFASNRRFYTCQARTKSQADVIAWTIDDTYTMATRVSDPLVGDIPAAARHSGCRLRFGPDGYLWIATGDASAGTAPQDLSSLGGKILRVDASTGGGAPDNPFPQSPLIYTYGHRNVQGLALRPGTGQMWSVEHGPSVDDEINLLVRGANYGWDPLPGYDERVPMTDLVKFPDATVARWSSGYPTLATSGGIFLEGSQWEDWEGRLAVASLKNRSLRVFEFDSEGTLLSEVVVPELDGTYGRLRTPMLGPDGALYVTTSNGGGADQIIRVSSNDPPEFPDNAAIREVAENTGSSTIVATVTAADPDGDTLTYELGGTDSESFTISAVGDVRPDAELDYETRDSYRLTVTATDPYGLSDSIELTIEITDVDEEGKVTLSTSRPRVGTPLVATLTDPDHDGSGITWSWAWSSDRLTWDAIDGVTSSSYTPGTADLGRYLRATALYTDVHSPGKLAEAETANPVAATRPPTGNTGGVGGGGSGGGGGGPGGGDEGGGTTGEPRKASEVFSDVPGGVWYESAVTWMIQHSITQGCTSTRFCPDQDLTRQQFVTFLWRAAGEPTPAYAGSEAFEDVTEGIYSDRAIGWAVSNGVTVGCTPGAFGSPGWNFCPLQSVTRAQMATLLYRHVEADHIGQTIPYTDVEPGSYYANSVAWITDFGIAPGCGPELFCPHRNATRAEAAAFINGVFIRPHTWGPANTSFG